MKNKIIVLIIVIVVIAIVYFGYQFFKTKAEIKEVESPKTVTVKDVSGTTVYKTKGLDLDANLYEGNTNNPEEIKVLQTMLRLAPEDIIGVFGPKTKSALFQRFRVDKITLREAFTKVGGVNSDGKPVSDTILGKHGWTSTPQVIYTLRPKSGSAIAKYNDFDIGEEYRAGSNFDAGEVIDIVGDDVILMKNGDSKAYGVDRINVTTRFYYAKKNQLSYV